MNASLPHLNFTLDRDGNGNKVLKVKPAKGKAFSIQTNGNLPNTHSNGVTGHTRDEVLKYVADHGTVNQCKIVGIL